MFQVKIPLQTDGVENGQGGKEEGWAQSWQMRGGSRGGGIDRWMSSDGGEKGEIVFNSGDDKWRRQEVVNVGIRQGRN